MGGSPCVGKSLCAILTLTGIIAFAMALSRIADPNYFWYTQGQPCEIISVDENSCLAVANFTTALVPSKCIVQPYYSCFQVGQLTRCRVKNQTHCFGTSEMAAERNATIQLLVWACAVIGAWLLILACFLFDKRKAVVRDDQNNHVDA